MRTLWHRLTAATVVTVRGHDVQVRGVLARKARRLEDALGPFLPCKGTVTITDGRVRIFGDLAAVEQRVRNSVLAHLG